MNLESLSIEQLVNYINIELEKGRTMLDIETKDFKVNDRVIVKRLNRKGYKRAKDGNRLFVSADNKLIQKNEVLQKYHTSKKAVEVAPLKDIDIKALSELVQMVEPLKELLQEYHNSKNIIEVVPNEIKIRVIEEVKARQFKIDKTVSIEWDNFCKEHKEYSVQDLINTALLEFIAKYK